MATIHDDDAAGHVAAGIGGEQHERAVELGSQADAPLRDALEHRLARIRGEAQGALQRKGLDDETNAHLMETIARVDRALTASRETNF